MSEATIGIISGVVEVYLVTNAWPMTGEELENVLTQAILGAAASKAGAQRSPQDADASLAVREQYNEPI